MKIIILVFACLTLVGAEEFEVKELKPADVQELQKLDEQVTIAADLFAKAQKTLADAKAARDNKAATVRGVFQQFEGECEAPSYPRGGTFSVYIAPTKKYRRVEVKGKYVLISSGTESCGSGISWAYTTNNNGTTTLKPDSTTTLRGPVEVR